MFDKLETLDRFCVNTEFSFDTMFGIINTSSRNIIIVNINTPFISSWVETQLKKHKLVVQKKSYTDFNNYNSLGSFLRIESDKKDVLLLDFLKVSSFTNTQTREIANDINTNRDLFTKNFNSVVLFTPPNLTFEIKSHAIDIISCMDLFIDTTKWFCPPNVLPIIKIRTYSNSTQQILNAFENDQNKYKKFAEIQNEIKSIVTYTPDIYNRILDKINQLPEGIFYYNLLISFVEKITQVPTKPRIQPQLIKDLKDLAIQSQCSCQLLDVQLILAEFFYRSCEYDIAIRCYRIVLQTMNELFSSPYEKYIFAFLQCNIVVSVYMKNGMHKPTELLDDLKLRLEQEIVNLLEDYDNFSELYLFLIRATCKHHTFIQHKEIFSKLNELKIQDPPMCSLNDEFNRIFLWETFIQYQFKEPVQFFSTNVSKLSQEIQIMVLEFCNGNYKSAHSCYKKAKYISKSYSNIHLYKFLEKYQKNMHYLYTKK